MESIVEELMKGRDLTNQLQDLILNPSADNLIVLQKEKLVEKILGSLNEALSVVSTGGFPEYSGEVSQIPASPVDQKPVDSSMIRKSRDLQNKTRKSSDPWIKVSSSMVDEYMWRKYGQKGTRNSKFPRCYFRCTHKDEQGCKATKQVQKIQDEPIKYQISYFGHHTCRKNFQPNRENIILDSYSEESNLINFRSYTPSGIYPSTSCPRSIKEESNEVQSEFTSDELPSDSITWPDLTPSVLPNTNEDFFAGFDSYASLISYHGTEMNFSSECDGFMNYFQ